MRHVLHAIALLCLLLPPFPASAQPLPAQQQPLQPPPSEQPSPQLPPSEAPSAQPLPSQPAPLQASSAQPASSQPAPPQLPSAQPLFSERQLRAPHPSAAAPAPRIITHATLFGVGRVRQLDTYLSPLNYRGPQLQFLFETQRPTRWRHISVQSLWHTDLSITDNQAGKTNLMGGNTAYDYAWHYNFLPAALPHLRLLAGGQVGGSIGFLYHTRNSNNPANAHAQLHLSASVAATYDFRIRRQWLCARYQADAPLAGVLFSPNYGQSYYEIFSLGHHEHNIRFAYPGNAPSLRQQLTIDIPVLRRTIRVGYLCDIRQSHVNQLKHHNYAHAFMLGWVKKFERVR